MLKITQADPETVIKTLLTNNWNTTNTDSKKPTFDISSEESVSKRQNFNNIDSEILIYERNRQNLHTSTGSAVKREAYHVALDIRTMVSRSHFLKLLGEAERVMDAAIVAPATGYDILDPTGTIPLHNDRTKGAWRAVMEITLYKAVVTRNA